ncbi:response regulator [Neobacillus sp. SM06]|uniref:response regulator n=1 Tax=Neobacillus sp. SM06 TaxID=3422492 RepID=UPI003D2E5496
MYKIRILVCDDYDILLKGIVQLLKLEPSFEVVGEARDGIEAIKLTEEIHPDVILMDVNMPNCSGIDAAALIRERNQEVKIIMLTVSDDQDDLFEAIKNGANGYLLKNINFDDLIEHVSNVYKGEPAFSPGLANKILNQFSQIASQIEMESCRQYELSSREKEVLELVTKGKTNKYIARELFISEYTVKKHLQRILEKLHVNNRAEAAAVAVQKGLIESDSNLFESV